MLTDILRDQFVNFDETRIEWGYSNNYTLDYKGKKEFKAGTLEISSKAFTAIPPIKSRWDN